MPRSTPIRRWCDTSEAPRCVATIPMTSPPGRSNRSNSRVSDCWPWSDDPMGRFSACAGCTGTPRIATRSKSPGVSPPNTGVTATRRRPPPAFDLLSDGVAGLGYLLKERVSQVDELVRALQEVCRGGSALDPKIVEGLMNRRSRESKSPLHGLTDRERDVLAEMATGKNNAAIARSDRNS